METIKYQTTANHLCKTQCPFSELDDLQKVGAYFCTERCPAFVSHDKEAQTVVCEPEKVPFGRFVWSDAMRKKYPNLNKSKTL